MTRVGATKRHNGRFDSVARNHLSSRAEQPGAPHRGVVAGIPQSRPMRPPPPFLPPRQDVLESTAQGDPHRKAG